MCFECVADARGWPESARTATSTCMLTGRVQKPNNGLGPGQEGKTRVTLSLHKILLPISTRWCSASGVDDFEGLCELIVLE